MAERRSQYTVGSSTGDETTETTNVRVLPVRGGFTQIDNTYLDGLWGIISPSAHICLLYIVRQTHGYRRESVRLSFKQLGDALGLSRNTVMKALAELEAAHIIGSDDSERGRTQVRAYFPLPAAAWTLPDATSAKNELVGTSADIELATTSAKNELVVSKIALVGAQTSAKNELHINKDINTVSKDNSDAYASGAADASAPPRRPSKKRERQRKLTDEELPAQREEAVWCNNLLAALRSELGVSKLPTEGKERAAAHWFYGELRDVEGAVEKIMACWRATKRDQFWQDKPLSLQKLTEFFPEYRRDPKGYRERMEHGGGRSRAPLAVPDAAPPRTFRTVDELSPWTK